MANPSPGHAVQPAPRRQLHHSVPLVVRQHRLIEELRAAAPRRVSATGLAQRLEVAVRTVERDVARLRRAGVPIDVKTGPRGGYGMDARRLLPPLSLTPGEAAALLATIAAVGTHASASIDTAASKLESALRSAHS